MHKSLLSDLIYTTTKEFVCARRKLFSFSLTATYSLVPPNVMTFHESHLFSLPGYIVNIVFKQKGKKKVIRFQYCQFNSQVTLQETNGRHREPDELQLNFEVERTEVITSFCVRSPTTLAARPLQQWQAAEPLSHDTE